MSVITHLVRLDDLRDLFSMDKMSWISICFLSDSYSGIVSQHRNLSVGLPIVNMGPAVSDYIPAMHAHVIHKCSFFVIYEIRKRIVKLLVCGFSSHV